MATYQRPGVYVQQTLNPIQPVAGPSSNTVAAFAGANDRGPVTPTLVTSWSQYVNLYGSWNTVQSNALPLALYMYFNNGGNSAFVNRVPGSGATAATRTFSDAEVPSVATLKVSANNVGTWGNSLNVTIVASAATGYFDLTVYQGGNTAANIVEVWPTISMTASDSRYAVNVINSGSNFITVTDMGSTATGATRNPTAIPNAALSSGSDGSAVTGSTIVSALGNFDTIQQSLVLNIPGYKDSTTVNGAISYATGSTRTNDVFVVVDGVNDTVANQLTLAATYTATPVAAVYYPQITIADPTVGVGASRNATLTIGAGASVVGLYSATDSSRGVFKAPAGLQARLAGVVSVPNLTNANLDSLNSASAPVNAIRYIPGSGIVVMGARTLQAGYTTRYVPVERTLIYLQKSLQSLTQFAVFEPNNSVLWGRINATVSSFLTGFWSQGGLTGSSPSQAFFVLCDSTNNTQASIDNGYVNIQVGVALQRPAEFVIINIGQYSGGSTITVS